MRTDVGISVKIRAILDIAEVDGLIGIQFDLSLRWHDSRLTFYDLKEDRDLNTLRVMERDEIWTPEIIFHNIKGKVESLNDRKAYLTVSREGTYKRSAASTLENAYIYEGRENPLTMSRVYSLDFLCEFDMAVYPFDTQVCTIVMVMKGNTGRFAEVFADAIEYTGPVDLSQYFVKECVMIEEPLASGEEIAVKAKFGRRVLSTFLTTYLPMVVLCLVSFSTNHFKAFFFEAIVTVNLTALLVQTTLFISLPNGLPKTNYIKMMDVWCIFNLFVPFAEVVIQTYMDNLREEESRAINHHGRTINVSSSSDSNSAKVGDISPVEDVSNGGKTDGAEDNSRTSSYPKQLIARNERVELSARRNYYRESVRVRQPRKMRAAQMVAKVAFPVTYVCFVACFLGIGMMN